MAVFLLAIVIASGILILLTGQIAIECGLIIFQQSGHFLEQKFLRKLAIYTLKFRRRCKELSLL
jgi:hypothetical protein